MCPLMPYSAGMDKKEQPNATASLPELVTMKTICERFGISAPTAHNLCLPKVKFGKRCVRYPVAEVKEYLERRTVIGAEPKEEQKPVSRAYTIENFREEHR